METPFTGRIGIVGAGALGTFYGARLARAGLDVHFLMRRDYAVVRDRGLTIHSIDGDFSLKPHVYDSPQAMGPCDLIIIGLKSTDNAALRTLLPPMCGAQTLVLTLQNGLGNEEAIAAAMPELDAEDRILGGTAFICSTRVAPGVVAHTAEGWLRIGERHGPPRDRTRRIASAFAAAGLRCELAENLVHARWEKLLWNIPFNGMGVAVPRGDTATILADPTLAAVARGLMAEVIAAARADGVALDPGLIEKRMRVTEHMGAYRTSMQLDYEAGRPLEVEAILGEPLRRAQRAGIAVPRMELLYGIVKRADAVRPFGVADGARESS